MNVIKLNTPPLYFGKKKRGKIPDTVKMYDGKMGTSVADFTLLVIMRRQCTGVVAKVWDVLGKLAPITLKMKHDLRKLIIDNLEWDSPLLAENQLKWIKNFEMIKDVRDILYVRTSIPSDALRTTARL